MEFAAKFLIFNSYNVMKNYAQVVSDLRKNANIESVNDCVIKGTAPILTSKGDTVISVVLNKEVSAYVENVPSKSNIIYIPPFVFAKALQECEYVAFLSDYVNKNPTIVNAVLSYAKVDVFCEPVKAGDEYINPFSNKETPKVIENDSIFHHVTNIRVSKIGLQMADRVMEKLADIAVAGTSVATSPNPREIEVEL